MHLLHCHKISDCLQQFLLEENQSVATIWQRSQFLFGYLSAWQSQDRLSYPIPNHCLLCSYAACLLTCSSCSSTTDLEALEPRKKFNPCCLLTPPPPPLFPPPPSLWHKPWVRHVTPALALSLEWFHEYCEPLRCLSYLRVKNEVVLIQISSCILVMVLKSLGC